MAQTSGIQWTDATWNPVAGCSIVSAGCANCYAMQMANRLEAMGQAKYAGLTKKVNGHAVWTGLINLDEESLMAPLHWKQPRRVFANSMSDLFHEAVPFTFIDRVFAVMALTPQHTYQVLTKRPKRMAEYLRTFEIWNVSTACRESSGGRLHRVLLDMGHDHSPGFWPLPNVWLGTSCEDQRAADERIPHLLRCPAAVRFVSAEPLLGPINFPQAIRYHFSDCACIHCCDARMSPRGERQYIDWIIVGGESGSGARPCDLAWIEAIVSWSREAEVACFVKQIGAHPVGGAGEIAKCKLQNANCKLKDKKGGDPAEWPEDLRVREFPAEVIPCV